MNKKGQTAIGLELRSANCLLAVFGVLCVGCGLVGLIGFVGLVVGPVGVVAAVGVGIIVSAGIVFLHVILVVHKDTSFCTCGTKVVLTGCKKNIHFFHVFAGMGGRTWAARGFGLPFRR